MRKDSEITTTSGEVFSPFNDTATLPMSRGQLRATLVMSSGLTWRSEATAKESQSEAGLPGEDAHSKMIPGGGEPTCFPTTATDDIPDESQGWTDVYLLCLLSPWSRRAKMEEGLEASMVQRTVILRLDPRFMAMSARRKEDEATQVPCLEQSVVCLVFAFPARA